jgi:hypothetical protein
MLKLVCERMTKYLDAGYNTAQVCGQQACKRASPVDRMTLSYRVSEEFIRQGTLSSEVQSEVRQPQWLLFVENDDEASLRTPELLL